MAANFLSYLRLPVMASSALAAVASSLLYFKQNDLIYPRNIPPGSRTEVPQPSDYDLPNAESLNIDTPDNERLHAYLLRPSKPELQKNVTMLMFHGNAGNVGHRLPIGKVLAESLGCNVLMVEYRGYGLSTGTPDEEGINTDAQTTLDYIRRRAELENTKLVIYGQSLGGAVAIKLTAVNQQRGCIAGLILENTFTSIRQLIPTAFPPAKYLAGLCHQYWRSDETIAAIQPKIPVLFLSGLRDEIVPASMMEKLRELCTSESKTWKTFPNGHHNDTVGEPGYFEAVWDFLFQEVRPPKLSPTAPVDVPQGELWS